MTEYLNIASLVLGIIGTISGLTALYLTYKSQKPNLKIEVKYCSHHYQTSDFFDSKMELRFLAGLEIKNYSIRGTSVNKIDFSFTENGEKHVIEDDLYGKMTKAMDSSGKEIIRIERRWIGPFETIGLAPILVEEFRGTQKEEIEGVFTVYSTHKKYTMKYTSKKDAKLTP
jgi:hypothetical protein